MKGANNTMPELGLSKEECIYYMQSYIDQIDKITSLFGNHTRLTNENKEKAQQQLKQLKLSILEDYELRETKRSEEYKTEVERNYFQPAINHAMVEIRVKTNSLPSIKWLDCLYSARMEIDYYLRELRE